MSWSVSQNESLKWKSFLSNAINKDILWIDSLSHTSARFGEWFDIRDAVIPLHLFQGKFYPGIFLHQAQMKNTWEVSKQFHVLREQKKPSWATEMERYISVA